MTLCNGKTRFPIVSLEQASFTEQYGLIPAKWWWCYAVGELN